MSAEACSVVGCSARPHARGMCIKHYQRAKRHGSPHLTAWDIATRPNPALVTSDGTRAVDMPVRDGYQFLRNQLLSKAVQADSGCWEWRASLNHAGYGFMKSSKRGTQASGLAHRALYTALIEDPDPALHLDHLCRNPPCINPEHLELVTPRVNWERGESVVLKRALSDSCVRGHLFDAANTRIGPRGDRQCRACGAALSRENRRKARESAGQAHPSSRSPGA